MSQDEEPKPSFLRALVDKLTGSNNPTEFDINEDGTTYTQQFEVGGDDVDVDFVDCQPDKLHWWSSKNGSEWRTDRDGTPF